MHPGSPDIINENNRILEARQSKLKILKTRSVKVSPIRQYKQYMQSEITSAQISPQGNPLLYQKSQYQSCLGTSNNPKGKNSSFSSSNFGYIYRDTSIGSISKQQELILKHHEALEMKEKRRQEREERLANQRIQDEIERADRKKKRLELRESVLMKKMHKKAIVIQRRVRGIQGRKQVSELRQALKDKLEEEDSPMYKLALQLKEMHDEVQQQYMSKVMRDYLLSILTIQRFFRGYLQRIRFQRVISKLKKINKFTDIYNRLDKIFRPYQFFYRYQKVFEFQCRQSIKLRELQAQEDREKNELEAKMKASFDKRKEDLRSPTAAQLNRFHKMRGSHSTDQSYRRPSKNKNTKSKKSFDQNSFYSAKSGKSSTSSLNKSLDKLAIDDRKKKPSPLKKVEENHAETIKTPTLEPHPRKYGEVSVLSKKHLGYDKNKPPRRNKQAKHCFNGPISHIKKEYEDLFNQREIVVKPLIRKKDQQNQELLALDQRNRDNVSRIKKEQFKNFFKEFWDIKQKKMPRDKSQQFGEDEKDELIQKYIEKYYDPDYQPGYVDEIEDGLKELQIQPIFSKNFSNSLTKNQSSPIRKNPRKAQKSNLGSIKSMGSQESHILNLKPRGNSITYESTALVPYKTRVRQFKEIQPIKPEMIKNYSRISDGRENVMNLDKCNNELSALLEKKMQPDDDSEELLNSLLLRRKQREGTINSEKEKYFFERRARRQIEGRSASNLGLNNSDMDDGPALSSQGSRSIVPSLKSKMYKRVTEDFDISFPEYASILKKYQNKIEECGIRGPSSLNGTAQKRKAKDGSQIHQQRQKRSQSILDGSIKIKFGQTSPTSRKAFSRDISPYDQYLQNMATSNKVRPNQSWAEERSALTRPSTSGASQDQQLLLRGFSSQTQKRNKIGALSKGVANSKQFQEEEKLQFSGTGYFWKKENMTHGEHSEMEGGIIGVSSLGHSIEGVNKQLK